MDAKPESPAGQALVTCGVDAGSIVLKGPDGDVTLLWKEGEKGQARAVPPGKYALRTTRAEKTKDGEHWFLSTTGPARDFKRLKAGRTVRFDVDRVVHFKAHVKRKGQRLQLGFGLRAAGDRGLSVYHNDKRVAVTYKVVSKRGKVLASGKMNYG